MRAPIWVGLGLSLAVALTAPALGAQPLDRAGMESARDDYFAGERGLGMAGMIAGTASIAGASVLYFQDDDFMKGASYPLAGFGLLELVAGGVVYFRTPGQVRDLESDMQRDPAKMRSDELDRMKRVNAQFDVLTVVWIVGLAAGAGTLAYGFIDKNDRVKGIGAGVMLESAILLAGDRVAAGNAEDYTRSLERFQPSAAAGGALIGVNGSF